MKLLMWHEVKYIDAKSPPKEDLGHYNVIRKVGDTEFLREGKRVSTRSSSGEMIDQVFNIIKLHSLVDIEDCLVKQEQEYQYLEGWKML